MNMKVKSLALVLAIVLLVGTAAPVLAKNPFADVPADHWAYDAIVQLAAAGLVEGYPDGTYGGARMMTRYEAAMVFARTLARLESLVADEVAQTNAGLRDDVTADVLADIEAAKAELVALIKDELANLDIPVEERIIEKVVVEQPIEVAQTDDAILQRLRDLEIGQEALEGDMSYVENRVLGLVDGLRYDLDSLKDQPFELTPEAEEVIADLVAEKVKEEIAAAELGAKEVVRTVVEKVVVDEDAVTEDQVVMIAEELLAKNLRDYDVLLNKALRDNREQDKRLAALEDGLTEEIEKTMLAVYDLNAEFGDELALLGIRVDDLEKVFIALEDRVTTLEKDQAALKAEVDRVKFGGTLKFEGENKDD
ncbi:MAG: S-layer homology domain-containing protein, partial [Firmicutes bacterium]|nr:S-layer homology domain-containing protein [Bacillota bacterium]